MSRTTLVSIAVALFLGTAEGAGPTTTERVPKERGIAAPSCSRALNRADCEAQKTIRTLKDTEERLGDQLIRTRKSLPEAERARFDTLQKNWDAFIVHACSLRARLIARKDRLAERRVHHTCRLEHQGARLKELKSLERKGDVPATAASAASQIGASAASRRSFRQSSPGSGV